MSEELTVIEGDDIVPTTSTQPLTLFGTTDPVEVLERAVRAANALAAVLNQKKLFAVISDRKYVTVEGWTLLGSMLGVFAQIEWTRKLDDGWEARAITIVAATGRVIGAGEAQCTRSERSWKTRDDYALRAMAQTRAISRALRGPLDFVVKLAGFVATPAEEMSAEYDHSPEQIAATHEAPPAEAPSAAQSLSPGELGRIEELYALAKALPKTPQTPAAIKALVEDKGFDFVRKRLIAAHHLQCGTTCPHFKEAPVGA